MESNNNYFNKYVETAISTAHELLTTVIQLKANIKLANEIIESQKNQNENITKELETKNETNDIIKKLENELIDIKEELSNERQEKAHAISEKNSLITKASHINTFTNEIKQLRKDLEEKNKELETLKSKKKKSTKMLLSGDF